MNTNLKVIGLTRLVIKPKSTAPESDAITTGPSELLNSASIMKIRFTVNPWAFSPLKWQL